MDSLEAALKRMENSLSKAAAQPPTQQPGSTTADGRSITMPSLASERESDLPALHQKTLPQLPVTSEKTSSPSAAPHGTPDWQLLPLRSSPQAQDELTRLLYQTYASQKAYGDKAQMMEYRDGMFQLVLAEYPFWRVREAFIQHIRQCPDLPTPSCVMAILEPKPKRLSAAVYVGLKNRIKDGHYPLSDERAFMRAFEAQEIEAAQETSEYQEAWDHRPRKGVKVL